MRFRLLALIVLGLLARPAIGAPHTWELDQVHFDDGGTAYGWIQVDSVSGSLLDFHIRVEGGNEASFPAGAYDASSGTSGQRLQYLANPVDSFVFSGGDGDIQTLLRLTPEANLEGQTGRIALDLAFADGNVECQGCSPFRLIVEGSLINLVSRDGFEGTASGGGGGGDGGDGDG